jgi:type IV pilus assembly protein PilV
VRIVKKQAGFSLLEVLITLVVVALGLLGVAGMQVASIKLADAADVRSRGAVYVNDIVEVMRSNRAGDYRIALGATPSGTDTASVDIARWKSQLAAALPSGDASIEKVATDSACDVLSGSLNKCAIYNITVQWDESRAKRSTTGPSPGLVTFKTAARL